MKHYSKNVPTDPLFKVIMILQSIHMQVQIWAYISSPVTSHHFEKRNVVFSGLVAF